MSCEHVVCAACAGPVVEGRCSACRSARASLHHSPLASPQLVALLIALLVALSVLGAQLR